MILKDGQFKHAIAFAQGNGLSKAAIDDDDEDRSEQDSSIVAPRTEVLEAKITIKGNLIQFCVRAN